LAAQQRIFASFTDGPLGLTFELREAGALMPAGFFVTGATGQAHESGVRLYDRIVRVGGEEPDAAQGVDAIGRVVGKLARPFVIELERQTVPVTRQHDNSGSGLALSCGKKALLLRQLQSANEEGGVARRGALLVLAFSGGERLQLLLPTAARRTELRRALLALKAQELGQRVGGSHVLDQLLQLMEDMLAAAEQRAAQATIVQYAGSAACKAQQRAAQAELARLLPLLQLGMAGAALQHQVETMEQLVRTDAKIDEILDQSKHRSKAEDRQHLRSRTASAFSIPRDDFQLKLDQELGRGANATVYRAIYDHDVVAAKVVNLRGISIAAMSTIADDMNHELALMAKLSHKRIVRVFGICEDLGENQIIMLMDLAEGGTMRAMLDTSAAPLDAPLAVKLMHDTAVGMQFLHSKKVLHRDIKSQNLLLDGRGRVLVSDFGISKHQTNATTAATTAGSIKGSMPWMAPEALEGEPATAAGDVFGFAVIMWEIMSRQTPWAGKPPHLIMRFVCDKPAPQNRPPLDAVDASYPPALVALMRECWAQDAMARPTFADIVGRLGDVLEAVTRASCASCGTAATGSKFCPECGAKM
jgi:tRNA A-37 threonylcarbamoyl transferase component Bud32